MQRVTRLLHARFNSSLHALVRELPLRDLLPLAAAIALLFSVLGPVTDIVKGARQPIAFVLANSVLAGVIALGYAFSSMRRNVVMFASTTLVNITWAVTARRLSADTALLPADGVSGRLNADATAILLVTVGSYMCFLWFMNGTAARYLRVRAEIDLARAIHEVLVPAIDVKHEGFEFFGFSSPSGDVGGDLVDVVHPEEGGWFGYVADVSGHGVSSGVVMGMFKSALRMRLRQPGSIASLLNDLNAVLLPLKSPSMFVTLACVRGCGAGTLEFAVAGHLPILRVPAGARAAEDITTPQIPISMFDSYAFVSSTFTCERGDLLALVTDGLTEVFDAHDRELGLDAIKGLLAESAALPLADIAGRIVGAARAHGAQMDDQTLLLIRAA